MSVIAAIPGPERTPANRFDLNIYESSPGALALGARAEVECVQVPFAPGAFVLTGLLTRAECRLFVTASEQLGYVPDEVNVFRTPIITKV